MVSDNGRHIRQEKIRRLEQELSRMEHDLYERYCEAGKDILEKAELENKKINALVDQIIVTSQNLAEAKQKKRCPECSASNDHDSAYCKRCGARLPDLDGAKEDSNGAE